MNKRQKDFITRRLIPFILREQGRGFGMDSWVKSDKPGVVCVFDNVERRVPKCGTVACIGGSIEVLTRKTAEEATGLTDEQLYGLFYNWDATNRTGLDSCWPRKYALAYAAATTPYKKARVAVALLREVVRTEGKCLDG